MRILSVPEMKELEEKTFSEFSFNESLIIENVGIETANLIEKIFLSRCCRKPVIFLMGKGNNAADGMAAARHLKEKGHQVFIHRVFADEGSYSPQLKSFYESAKAFGVEEIAIDQVPSQCILVDALFGTGIKLPLSKEIEDILDFFKERASSVVALDIVSGVDGNTGEASPKALQADYTFTIGCPKRGHFLHKGASLKGKLEILSGGFPRTLCLGDSSCSDMFYLNDSSLKRSVKRDDFFHKNCFGHVGIIGGSLQYAGAPNMSALAAIKTGVGLVSLLTSEKAHMAVSARCSKSEVIISPLDEKKTFKDLDKYHAVVLGPGLSLDDFSQKVVEKVLNEYEGNLVIDADALTVLEKLGEDKITKRKAGKLLLTPHLGEMARFFKVEPKILMTAEGQNLVKDFSQKNDCFVLLKNAISFLYTPQGKVFVLDGANSGMAKGGSGDVLSGLCGGFLALNSYGTFEENVIQAMLIHYFGGKKAREVEGEREMTPTTVLNFVSQYII